MLNDIHEKLFSMQDLKYRQFVIKLLPAEMRIGINIIGVRLPNLRRLAKQIVKDNQWEKFLQIYKNNFQEQNNLKIYFEEIMLEGFVIAYIPVSFKQKENLIREFIPKIDNWSVCDSFCASFHLTDADKSVAFSFIKSCINTKKPYELRFCIVMLLDYFLTLKYEKQSLNLIISIQSEHYSVQMAKAWAISKYFTHYPEKGIFYLQKIKSDNITFKMALQKIRDSRKISQKYKQLLNILTS